MRNLFVKEIRLAAGHISLERNQILCFVGANSTGKSSLLSAIHLGAQGQASSKKSQYSDIALSNEFNSLDDVLECRHISLRNNGVVWPGDSFQPHRDLEGEISRWAKSSASNNQMNSAFIHFIDAMNRFEAVSSARHINQVTENPSHPFHILYANPDLELELDRISQELFGKSTILNPGAGSHLVLHFGERPNAQDFGGDRTQAYANIVAKIPQISLEGDGVRAKVGLVSRVLTADYGCILIDEPDLYLHPPQAFALARILAREKPDSQLLFATHSARFLQGLFSEAPDRLKLIRLKKYGEQYSFGEVDNSVFQDIQSDILLKFTNILESVFYDFCFICEDNTDCLFFKNILERLDLIEPSESSLWVGVQGKQNIAKTAAIAKRLCVNPICIVDFDVISAKNDSIGKVFKPIVNALGGDGEAVAQLVRTRLHNVVQNNPNLTWSNIKSLGLHALESDQQLHTQVSKIIQDLRSIGLFILPSGELESLRTPRSSAHGLSAVVEMLGHDLNSSVLTKANRQPFRWVQ